MTVTCPYCSKPAEFVGGAEIYPHREDLAPQQYWLCRPCDAFVGCHAGTTLPLGRLANAQLRKAKVAAHQAFNPLWKDKPQNLRSQYRKTAYRWLAKQLGIHPRDAHIGMFDEKQCAAVVEICRKRAAEILAAEMTGK